VPKCREDGRGKGEESQRKGEGGQQKRRDRAEKEEDCRGKGQEGWGSFPEINEEVDRSLKSALMLRKNGRSRYPAPFPYTAISSLHGHQALICQYGCSPYNGGHVLDMIIKILLRTRTIWIKANGGWHIYFFLDLHHHTHNSNLRTAVTLIQVSGRSILQRSEWFFSRENYKASLRNMSRLLKSSHGGD